MSAGDDVRNKISRVELTLTEAGSENAVHAIVDVLKEIARKLDDVERRAKNAER
jgi:hypothetical protein